MLELLPRAVSLPAVVGRMEATGIELINPQHLVKWNMDKCYLSHLAAGGTIVPEFVVVRRGQPFNANEVLEDRGWSMGVVKPTVSAWASETVRLTGQMRGLRIELDVAC